MARVAQVCSALNASVSLSVETTTNTVDDVTIVSSTRRPVTVIFYNAVRAVRRQITQAPNQTQVYDLTPQAIPVTLQTVGAKTMLRAPFTVLF